MINKYTMLYNRYMPNICTYFRLLKVSNFHIQTQDQMLHFDEIKKTIFNCNTSHNIRALMLKFITQIFGSSTCSKLRDLVNKIFQKRTSLIYSYTKKFTYRLPKSAIFFFLVKNIITHSLKTKIAYELFCMCKCNYMKLTHTKKKSIIVKLC